MVSNGTRRWWGAIVPWEGHDIPRSLTSTALLFLRPVACTLKSALLGIGVPSLPLVTRRRCTLKLAFCAIASKMAAVGASEGTSMVSGRFLIGRPVVTALWR